MEIVKRICVVGGAGHVGLPLAIVLAEHEFEVDILDVNQLALAMIASGRMPFIEQDGERRLAAALATGRLHTTADVNIVQLADAVICVIGTPVDEHLNPQANVFYQVIKDLRPHMRDGQTLILRSTVYPGLSARIDAMFRDFGPDVHVSVCPERVAQGHSLREIREIPQVISAFDDSGLRVARAIFSRIAVQVIEVEPLEAELAKLFCNSYRYLTFAIANEFYMIARDAGVDFRRVHYAATHDNPRTHLMPSSGLAAGPCLLKDTMQLATFSNNRFFLGHAAMLINEGQPQYLVNALKQRCDLRNRCVGILGMTFKADCDDPRDSLAFKLRKLAALEAREVIMHDPYLSGPGFLPLEEVIERASVLIVGVPHSCYRGLRIPPDKIVEDIWDCTVQDTARIELEVVPLVSAVAT
jgi:UDP-N-acetyl-D-mannosaminuronic acid dehydrogenase